MTAVLSESVLDQNGPNGHFGQNALIPNWVLAFAGWYSLGAEDTSTTEWEKKQTLVGQGRSLLWCTKVGVIWKRLKGKNPEGKNFRKLLRRKQSSAKISKISRNTIKSSKSEIWEIFWNIFCEHFFLPRSFQKFLPFVFLPSGSFRVIVSFSICSHLSQFVRVCLCFGSCFRELEICVCLRLRTFVCVRLRCKHPLLLHPLLRHLGEFPTRAVQNGWLLIGRAGCKSSVQASNDQNWLIEHVTNVAKHQISWTQGPKHVCISSKNTGNTKTDEIGYLKARHSHQPCWNFPTIVIVWLNLMHQSGPFMRGLVDGCAMASSWPAARANCLKS